MIWIAVSSSVCLMALNLSQSSTDPSQRQLHLAVGLLEQPNKAPPQDRPSWRLQFYGYRSKRSRLPAFELPAMASPANRAFAYPMQGCSASVERTQVFRCNHCGIVVHGSPLKVG